jgi:hypothetical protein
MTVFPRVWRLHAAERSRGLGELVGAVDCRRNGPGYGKGLTLADVGKSMSDLV